MVFVNSVKAPGEEPVYDPGGVGPDWPEARSEVQDILPQDTKEVQLLLGLLYQGVGVGGSGEISGDVGAGKPELTELHEWFQMMERNKGLNCMTCCFQTTVLWSIQTENA